MLFQSVASIQDWGISPIVNRVRYSDADAAERRTRLSFSAHQRPRLG
jgi:hypothetical protein